VSNNFPAKNPPARHFIEETDLSATEFLDVLANAIELKESWQSGAIRDSLHNKTLAMIFEKASTRTRTSFAAGMAQLGGHALDLSPANSQLGRGEPITDTSQVLSEMVNAVSYIKTAALLGFTLALSCPEDVLPNAQLLTACSANVEICDSPEDACRQANLVTTDVWASMGEETDGDRLTASLRPYQVDKRLLATAASDAIFLHCLPAHRGEEVTAEVIDGEQSVVWQQAGNRLHAQKSLLEFLIL